MHPSLKAEFTGSSNQAGSTAAARLQFTFDLLSGHLIDTGLHSFTDVDQGAAQDILACLKPGAW
jgi:hypothetical protein